MPAGEPPHPCGRDAYRKTDSTARWLDDQPGPSRCQSSRQGYCSYCRVIYSNLDQHISSSRHRESVRVSSRASSVVSSVSSLMERFLQDVIHHHPHRYNDTRPPHEDLPSLSCPLMPREELAELCPSNEDSHSLGTRDELSSSEGTSCHIACQQEVDVVTTADDGGQSEDRTVLEAGPGRPSPPIAQYLETHAHPAERDAHTVHGHTHAPGARSPPSVHRKAHRKSNRRRERASSSSSSLPTLTQLCSPPRGQLPSSRPQLCPTPSVRQLPSSGPQPASSGPQPASSVPQPASSGPHPPSSVPCPASSDPQFTCTPRAPQLSSRGPQLSSSSPQPFASGPKPSSSSPHPACSGPQSASVGLQLLSSSSPQLSSRGLQLSSTPRDPQLSSINRQLTSSGPQLYSTPRAPPLSSHGPQPPSSSPQPCSIGPHLAPQPSREALAWTAWQSERRKVQKDEAFSGDQTELIEDTIEKVIQTCAHGHSPPGDLQRDAESFHFSLPDSLRTDSEDWDTPVQEVLDAPALAASEAHAPILVELSCLTQRKVELEDHLYSTQLDSALHTRLAREEVEEQEVEEGGGWYRDLPIEAVLPAPPHIPESFRGKSWALIEQEDQRKVEDLVRQFRWERFISYFDSDSMARYGRRRSQNKKNRGLNKEAEAEHHILPLLDHNDDDDDPVCIRRKRKRRAFRLASRCQVVKVSHATQTVPLVVPSVRQTPATPATPKTTNQEMGPSPEEEDGEGRIPDLQSMLGSLRLPASYAHLVTPLQARTSVVYLLCSPSPTPPPLPPAASSASPKRCRKRRRPLDRGVQGLKVTYKRVALRLYDPSSNRILRSTPRGCSSITLQGASRGANKRPHSVVRQLFKNLSPQQNSEGPAGGRGRKRSKRSEALSAGRSGQDSPPGVRVQGEPSLGDGNRRPLCTLSTDSSKDAALGKRGRRRKGGGEVERSDQQADVKKMRRRTVARSQGREPSSSARPRKGGGRQRADGGKVQGSRGPVEVPPAGHEEEKAQPYSRRLRARKRTGCLCCKS